MHFEHEGAFHMEFLQSWRTTRERDARELVHFLAQIMEWGKGRFKDCIVEKLDKVPRYGVFGYLQTYTGISLGNILHPSLCRSCSLPPILYGLRHSKNWVDPIEATSTSTKSA